MTLLVSAALIFVLTHVGISGTGLRANLIERLGLMAYRGLYSVIALAAITGLIMAYRQAPFIELWPSVGLVRLVPAIVMPFAFIFLVGSFTVPNPTAAGMENTFNGAASARGLIKVTRHPFMWAVALWAAAHMIANGDAAAVVLFTSFIIVALAGARSLDARKAASEGEAWSDFAAVTSFVPFAAIVSGRQTFAFADLGVLTLVIAIVAYAAMLHLHVWIFGVIPW